VANKRHIAGLREIILEFAFERKNMLCHIFSAESEATALRLAEKGRRRKSAERGRGYKWKVPREYARRGRNPVYAAGGTLAL